MGSRRHSHETDPARANDVVSSTHHEGERLLTFSTPNSPIGPEADTISSLRFDADPLLAMDVAHHDASSLESPAMALSTRARSTMPGPGALAHRFVTSAHEGSGPGAAGGPTVVVRVDALVEIGGFDPTYPGLGWADVATRLTAAGWRVNGIALDALPFIAGLHTGLGVIDQFRTEARWLQLHDTARSLGVFARRTKDAIDRIDGRRSGNMLEPTATIDVVASDAAQAWQGAAPHAVQSGIGDRADWRFLLPTGQRRHTLIVDATPHRWDWLVTDGWTQRITRQPDSADAADVALVGVGQAAAEAARAVGDGGSICVLRARRPTALPGREAGQEVAGELTDLGFVDVRRYLVVPNHQQPKRFIPLDHPGGLAWLSAPRPPSTVGRLSTGNTLRRRVAGLAGQTLSRLVGDLAIVATRPTGPSRPTDSSESTGGSSRDGERQPTTCAFGGLDVAHMPPNTSDTIVLTSGFDEGSRAVLLPLVPNRLEPQAVIKIASRPRYNNNVDQESSLLQVLDRQIGRSGLLPETGGTFAVGTLRASTETYAGRWSGSDVLNEQAGLSQRLSVLELIADAIEELGARTTAGHVIWSSTAFETYIGGWLDQLGSDAAPTLHAFRTTLLERSEALEGLSVPLVRRHYDLGPWNVVFSEPETGGGRPRSPVTIVDWELAPPRTSHSDGLAGADLVYFIKYWLHIAMDVRSADDELTAFAFLAAPGTADDPRSEAKHRLITALDKMGLPPAFVPLLSAHVWAEAACYTMERRKHQGADSASPGRYLATLARYRHKLLASWPQ